MQYQGGKYNLAHRILPIILKDRKPGQLYVEPFIGGANTFHRVSGPKLGSDSNKCLMDFWKALQKGYSPPEDLISKEEYQFIKDHRDLYSPLSGWAAFACSFGGKFFNSYTPNWQASSRQSVLKQRPGMKDAFLECCSYLDLEIPDESLVYCDPPYEGTTSYKFGLCHAEFWDWCRELSCWGSTVYVSEYNAPLDFEVVWEGEHISTLSKKTNSQPTIEKLFKAPF